MIYNFNFFVSNQKDPTIQRASQNAQIVDSALNDYNPFAQKNVQTVIFFNHKKRVNKINY